jgi:hypothetical protein
MLIISAALIATAHILAWKKIEWRQQDIALLIQTLKEAAGK